MTIKSRMLLSVFSSTMLCFAAIPAHAQIDSPEPPASMAVGNVGNFVEGNVTLECVAGGAAKTSPIQVNLFVIGGDAVWRGVAVPDESGAAYITVTGVPPGTYEEECVTDFTQSNAYAVSDILIEAATSIMQFPSGLSVGEQVRSASVTTFPRSFGKQTRINDLSSDRVLSSSLSLSVVLNHPTLVANTSSRQQHLGSARPPIWYLF
jgi:hypothetical protein